MRKPSEFNFFRGMLKGMEIQGEGIVDAR